LTLIPIGQPAARLGLSTWALRYYDDRLAFIKIARHLGVPLQTAAAVLDTPSRNWRPIV
jgi:DNA-binding transcriptional MerR regulator